MALVKEMEINGMLVTYHRVTSVNNITNISSIIEVNSYLNKEVREREKEALEKGELTNTRVEAIYYNVPYDKNLNVDNAYEYLKTLPEFEDAVDD